MKRSLAVAVAGVGAQWPLFIRAAAIASHGLAPFRGAEIWRSFETCLFHVSEMAMVKPQGAANEKKHCWVARLRKVLLGNAGSLIHSPRWGP